MSNAQNQFLQGYSEAEFIDLFGDLLQPKFDKKGGEVAGSGNNLRSGANRANLSDDLMLAIASGAFGGPAPTTTGLFDNRNVPIEASGVFDGGNKTGFIDIPGGFNSGTVRSAALVPSSDSSPTTYPMTLQFFRDPAKLKPFGPIVLSDVSDFFNFSHAVPLLTAQGEVMQNLGAPGTFRLHWELDIDPNPAVGLGALFWLEIELFTRTEIFIPRPGPV